MTVWKGSPREVQGRIASSSESGSSRPCEALEQFFRRVDQVQTPRHILMLGELCGANVSFLGERGFRVCMEPDVRRKPEGTYAGALVWDTLSLIPPDEARQRTALLHDALAAGGAVLAFFDAPSAAGSCPSIRYRIVSENLVCPEKVRGRMRIAHPYHNRDIVRIFDRFDQVLLQMRRNGQRDALFFKAWAGASGS
jgi:hypothetical protein